MPGMEASKRLEEELTDQSSLRRVAMSWGLLLAGSYFAEYLQNICRIVLLYPNSDFAFRGASDFRLGMWIVDLPEA